MCCQQRHAVRLSTHVLPTWPPPSARTPPPPQDALHGDIGILSPQDLLVCFSKSGGTEELIRLGPFARVGGCQGCWWMCGWWWWWWGGMRGGGEGMSLYAGGCIWPWRQGQGREPHACSCTRPPHPCTRTRTSQAKGARLVAITSVAGSALEALCDLAVQLPLERELCPFDLAPVTSTAIQMVFGDTVAIALMQVLGVGLSVCVGGGSVWACVAAPLSIGAHPHRRHSHRRHWHRGD